MSEILSPHSELHKSQRSNWLRAAVLGINDGIVSTASLMIGVSAAQSSRSTILTAGIAGLTAGALSMAVGEYVSVSSQKDSVKSDTDIEHRSLVANPKAELAELAHIYEHRGLKPALAKQVAVQLHEHNAEEAHLRDELGIDTGLPPKPTQAAFTSAAAFSMGAVVPVLATLVASSKTNAWAIVITSLLALALSGAAGAYLGGGHKLRAASRVFVGGGLAMATTALIGHFVGRAV
jgi:VIT1/CCC1 family predicted Fe2+/Mn2+ transporter